MISNGLCKQLCLRVFPQVASIAYVAEATYNSEPASVDPHNNTLEREHKTYASLFWACTSFRLGSCLGYPASASSTNNYPEESIINTMNLSQKCLDRYWSSKGHDDPEVPETLIYYLDGTICVITDIDIIPFQGLFYIIRLLFSSCSLFNSLIIKFFIHSFIWRGKSNLLSKVCEIPNGSSKIQEK